MRCLRCGYCCTHYPVAIVKDPEKGIDEKNIILHSGKKPCIHLKGDKPGEYSCAVHEYPWYKETPCFSHTQIESKDSDCRIGVYMLKSQTKNNKNEL